MFIVVKSIIDVKIPQARHGKKLAKLVCERLGQDLPVTIDFSGLTAVSQGFAQELLLPLLIEFGAERLNRDVQWLNVIPSVQTGMNTAATNISDYFDQFTSTYAQHGDDEIYELNLFWLVKARELARDNSHNARLMMGLTDDELRLALGQLSTEDIHRIARSGWLCFAPRFTSRFITQLTNRTLATGEIQLSFSGGLC